jgi:hypothetical protein
MRLLGRCNLNRLDERIFSIAIRGAAICEVADSPNRRMSSVRWFRFVSWAARRADLRDGVPTA